MSESSKIPQHIAIIMDGNGRWAKKHFLPRSMGHSQGSKVVEKICRAAHDMGVKYLTIYAFSTENWSRSEDEVNTLMDLLRSYMKECIEKSKKNNMRVRVIGDVTRLDEDLQQSIRQLEEFSKDFTGLNFQVALNYGGRDDILRAVKRVAAEYAQGQLDLNALTEKQFSEYLDTQEIPEPDLLIRTSGEMRISNFLIWQMAYTEYYFTDTLWPDFNEKELKKAVEYYGKRDRRFGARKEE